MSSSVSIFHRRQPLILSNRNCIYPPSSRLQILEFLRRAYRVRRVRECSWDRVVGPARANFGSDIDKVWSTMSGSLTHERLLGGTRLPESAIVCQPVGWCNFGLGRKAGPLSPLAVKPSFHIIATLLYSVQLEYRCFKMR